MKFYQYTCMAGLTVFRSIKSVASSSREKRRGEKNKPTREAAMKANQKAAEKKLAMKLNHNFKPGDYHITLTYDGEAPTPEEARKDKQNFLRRLKYECDKIGIEFKRIDVTEYLNARIHHHMVITHMDSDIINRAWKKGHVYFSTLNNTGDYSGLAMYLIKETSKTFRDDSNPNKRRYSQSRNIVMPEIKREIVSGRTLKQDIKPLKGYMLIEDSVNRYEHPFTHAECLDYMMIAIDKPRTKWPRGKTVKNIDKHIPLPYAEEQIKMGGLE